MITRFFIVFSLLTGLLSHSLSCFPQTGNADQREIQGKVKQSLSFFSQNINENISYSVYLPPSYCGTQDSFPVFYLLHGLGGNENSWMDDFFIHRIIDSLICSNAIPPMLVIMPDGRRSYFINDFRNAFPYETIFIQEFIPFIDSIYRTKGSKPYRVIGGLSMGGFGALINCFRHPGYFTAAISLSAAVRTDSMIFCEKPVRFNQVFKPVFGDSIQQYRQVTQHWRENNPLYLTGLNPDTLKTINWYIDCGFNDYLLPGNEALHDLFTRYRIPHEFHIRQGNHDKAYWKSGLVPALLYAGRILGGKQ